MKVNEKNLPTQQCPPQAHTRLSEPDEHAGWSRRHTPAPQQGTQTSECPNPPQTGATLDTGRHTFPKAVRILVRREFLALQRKGRRRHTPHFVVITRPRHTGCSRLGITATRRFGNAVMAESDQKTPPRIFSPSPGRPCSQPGYPDHSQVGGWTAVFPPHQPRAGPGAVSC